MAESEKSEKEGKISKKHEIRMKSEEKPKIAARSIVRILSSDIPGDAAVYHGLTKIKGISWSFSHALCMKLGIDKTRKVDSLTESEIEKITNFIKNPVLPAFLLNRRRDIETGINKHMVISDLDLQRDFDIKRMKKIRSYKGWRHALGQPVRGQRTRSHFRKGRAIGVQKSKSRPAKKKE